MEETYTLYELTCEVQQAVRESFPDSYWITAEISDLRLNTSGHCYLELVEKDASGNRLKAKARAMIWSYLYPALKACFEEQTGQILTSGIKVLVQVQVEFHPLYGFSLTITNINPSYTIGDLAVRRREILRKLEEEGIIHMNKELPLPLLPQRVAVISSNTAAGYGDFCNQLESNPHGFVFHTTLFPAVMQGDRVEKSIIQALDHISGELDNFDVVVIIRGGGATTDLAGFDTLNLAENCAQFPLPIITGIGHERDDTILDMVSHTRVKTPTAAAEFLISCMEKEESRLNEVVNTFVSVISRHMDYEKNRLEQAVRKLPLLFNIVKAREESRLQQLNGRLESQSKLYTTNERHRIQMLIQRLQIYTDALMQKERTMLHLLEERTRANDPRLTLQKGYSITLKNGKAVKDAATLQTGDRLMTKFAKGSIQTTVTKQ